MQPLESTIIDIIHALTSLEMDLKKIQILDKYIFC